MLNDALHTLCFFLLLIAGVIAVELGVVTVKALMIRSQRSKLETMSNNIVTLSKDNSDLRVMAYSMKCENQVHASTIERLQKENGELREKIVMLMDGTPVPPEGFKFERITH